MACIDGSESAADAVAAMLAQLQRRIQLVELWVAPDDVEGGAAVQSASRDEEGPSTIRASVAHDPLYDLTVRVDGQIERLRPVLDAYGGAATVSDVAGSTAGATVAPRGGVDLEPSPLVDFIASTKGDCVALLGTWISECRERVQQVEALEAEVFPGLGQRGEGADHVSRRIAAELATVSSEDAAAAAAAHSRALQQANRALRLLDRVVALQQREAAWAEEVSGRLRGVHHAIAAREALLK